MASRTPTRKPAGRASPDRLATDGAQRLQKVLAAAGLGSRRACEQLIEEGRVAVDRRIVTRLGTKVDPHRQEIRVDGEALPQTKLVYLAVHKPTGVVSTSRDPSGRPRVVDLVPPEAGRLFAVGRLDMSSEGLILLTNDGPLADRLTHPRYGVPKTYHVQVMGRPERDVLAKLRQGVHLAEGMGRVVSVRVKSHRKQYTMLEMVLAEGRNREIRRLLARLGHKVQRLIRVAVGPVRLGNLPAGAYRALTQRELQALRRASREASAERGAPQTDRKRRGRAR